jgi:putative tricarboxylic transport membrane protein
VSHLKVIWEILSRPLQLLWCAFIGVLIGVLPAIGGSAASMMAYDQAKKLSRRPEKFGSGAPEGIIASESSNNANVGGSLVTIMAFGIPGDAVTASSPDRSSSRRTRTSRTACSPPTCSRIR